MKEKFINFYRKYHLHYLFLIALLYAGKVVMYESSKLINTDWHIIDMKIDDYIPFCKYFIIFYCTYYFFAPILLYLISYTDKRKFYRLLISVAISCIFANICFAFYQVKMIRPEINGNDVFDLLVKFIYKADAKAVNCFPSIHAIIGTTMIIGGYKTNKFSKKLQITSIICGIGCTISTVFVKQHYFVDMVVGTLIMIVFYSLILWIDKKRDIKK